jgi:hypothetical protein
MTNPFGVVLHTESVRWAAAEGVSENDITAVLLLHEKSVDEIVAKLRPGEPEQSSKVVGRRPSCYPLGTLNAVKAASMHCRRRRSTSQAPRPMWHFVGSLRGSSRATVFVGIQHLCISF